MVSVTAMSSIFVDIFDASGEIWPGGEALNFAAVISQYNHISTSLLGAIGDDIYGERILSSMKSKPIDQTCIHIVSGGETASNRIYLTPDGDRYFKCDSLNCGVYLEFQLSEIDIEKLKMSDLVFINFSSPNFNHVLELKKQFGFDLAVDFSVFRDFTTMERLASFIDFFFISGEEDILPIFNEWSKKYKGIFNITLAEKGSVSYQYGKEYRVKAVPVNKVIDTTGCGDSYHAGFIGSYTKNGDILSAMEEGSKIASNTLTFLGGFK